MRWLHGAIAVLLAAAVMGPCVVAGVAGAVFVVLRRTNVVVDVLAKVDVRAAVEVIAVLSGWCCRCFVRLL